MTEVSSRGVGVPAWSTDHWLGMRQTRGELLVAWDYQGEDIGEGRRRGQWRDFFSSSFYHFYARDFTEKGNVDFIEFCKLKLLQSITLLLGR
jgi:hypothetical protein